MLKSQKKCTLLSSNHKWIESIFPDRTCVLATDVEENGSKFIFLVEILVINPVSLLVWSVVLVIIVINRTVLCELFEIGDIDMNGGIRKRCHQELS